MKGQPWPLWQWMQVAVWALVVITSGPQSATAAEAAGAPADYLVGGPLAGVPLPFYPTLFGEPPGYPGSIPELQQKDARGDLLFVPQGMAREYQLYEGSVEHFRAYWFKYLPVKSFFDRQSLLHGWAAKDVPGVAAAAVEQYAAPVYWVPRHAAERPTGKSQPPVPVVRCRVGDPVFKLDLGELPVGMYALRVIGAVATKDIIRHRRPLIVKLTVNDGLAGEESTSRFRCKYVDEFYAVAEFYFHAPVKRRYQAAVTVADGSQVELLVHSLDLHDALAGTTRRPIKTRATLNPPLTEADLKSLPNDEARLARDGVLWDALPPPNAQPGFTYGMGGDDPKSNWPNIGAGGQTPEQIAQQWGNWGLGDLTKGTFLANDKLKLTYTLADLQAGKPLPAPYPYPDNGTGVWTAPAKPEETPQNWFVVANAVRDRYRQYIGTISSLAGQFRTAHNAAAGRDAAVMLCRLAWQAPAIDSSNNFSSLLVQPGPYGRDMGCRRRDPHGCFLDVEFLDSYDKLFDLMRSDPGLAASVGRFIPWVQQPADVIQLIDVYLVQTLAKRYLRYHFYYSNECAKVVMPAAILSDRQVTDPWLEWLFSATFLYPLPPSGIQDLLVTGNDRDGVGYIGSFYYGQVEEAASKGRILEAYVRNGGNPKYDLSNPQLYPKVRRCCDWFLQTRVAGLYFPRVGDVTGPDKGYGAWFEYLPRFSALGWQWTHEPRFAWVVKHFGNRKDYSDAEWQELEAAAARQPRAPWLENRSRVLANWCGILESGVQYDDVRFRRAAMLRIGQGWGHAHNDGLDLQLYAHGYPMTLDGGQRPGYSSPGDAATRVHNLVEVDGRGWLGHSWVTALSDVPGAGYLAAQAEPPTNHPETKLMRRQLALVDVDEGQGAATLTPAQLAPQTPLPPGAVSPNSYVFDVVRVAGGKTHTYCFHATVEDEFAANTKDVVTGDALPAEDKAYLSFPQPELNTAGVAPATVEATWRMTRGTPDGKTVFGCEQSMAPGIWNADNPRKYTRLQLLGHAGARVLTGRFNCHQWHYSWTTLFVQERSAEGGEPVAQSVFPAVIQPYVGEPFITDCKLLDVPNNETDALRAVAVAVTTKNGHRDLCFADGRPTQARQAGDLRVSAEFAFCSRDAQGLRLATLTGGTLLAAPEVMLAPAARERQGQVTKADYARKTCQLDQAWPEAALLAGRTFEIGVPGHWTTYTIAQAAAAAGATEVSVTHGADFYCARVLEVDEKAQTAYCALAIPHCETNPSPGVDQHWVASNEEGTKFWRADYLGGVRETQRYGFRLDGPVTLADFGRTAGLRLWEYGVGDQVRQSTCAALRRVEAGLYELTADVALSVGLPGEQLEWSSDREHFRALTTKKDGPLATARVELADLLPAGRGWLRVR